MCAVEVSDAGCFVDVHAPWDRRMGRVVASPLRSRPSRWRRSCGRSRRSEAETIKESYSRRVVPKSWGPKKEMATKTSP